MATNNAKITLSAEDKTAQAFAAVSRNVDKLGLNLGTLRGLAGSALGALAVPVSAGAIAQLITESAKAIDDIKDLSEAVGSSVENISALDGIARDTGATLDSVGSILVKFNGVLKDADPDKGPGAILKALNLDIEALKNLDPAEALRQVAVALDTYGESGNKARAIQELFGKSVKEAGPFLRDLAEAGALNARVTSQQAEEVEKFNKEWAKLAATTQDVGRSFSIGIITELNVVIRKFSEAERAGKSFLSVLFLSPSAMEEKNRAAGAFLDQARADLRDLENAPFRLPDSDPRMIAARERVRRTEAPALPVTSDNQSANELARLSRGAPPRPELKLPPASASTGGGGGGGRRSGGGGRSGGAAKDPDAEAKRYLESLQKQLQATENLTVYEKLLADLRVGNLGKVNPLLQSQLETTAKQIDASREAADVLKDRRQLVIEEFEAIEKANNEYQDFVQSLLDATPTAQLEKQRDAMLALAMAFETGQINAQQFGEAATTYLGNVPADLEKANDAASELGMTFASAFEDAVVNAGDLKDVLKGLEQDIIRIVTRKLVTEPLANFATTAFSTFAATAFADGGIMTGAGPMPLKTYANGGIANSPQVAIYGEGSMNEAYVPLPDGRRIPVHMKGGGGGGQALTVTNNFNVPASVDRRTQEQIATMTGAAVQRAVQRNT